MSRAAAGRRISHERLMQPLKRRVIAGRRRDKKRPVGRRKQCKFCADEAIKIDYKDASLLKYFITDRGKLVPRRLTGNCAKHQREIVDGGEPGADDRPDAVRGDGELSHADHSERRHGQPRQVGRGGQRQAGIRAQLSVAAGARRQGDRRATSTRVEHEKRVIAARTAKLAKAAQAEADTLSRCACRSRARSAKRTSSTVRSPAATSPRRCSEKGVTVDPKKIHLDEPIKALGDSTCR